MGNGYSDFTGNILHAVVKRFRDGDSIEIFYSFGGPKNDPEEDWSIPVEAHQRKSGSYDIWISGKMVSNEQNIEKAVDKMNRFIDSKGKLKLEEL